ncbi:MAG: hypothetical protein ACRD5K_11695 [Candidatus Acidiferrales bacterium]
MKKATISNAVAALCLLATALTGCAAQKTATNPPASPPTQQDWTVTAAWQENFTNFVPCSSTVTKGCVSGFTWGYLQGTTRVAIKTSAPTVCAGPTQPETCTDTVNATLGIGPVTFYIVANYVDNAGIATSTAADQSAQQNVSLAPPAGLAVSWQ